MLKLSYDIVISSYKNMFKNLVMLFKLEENYTDKMKSVCYEILLRALTSMDTSALCESTSTLIQGV